MQRRFCYAILLIIALTFIFSCSDSTGSKSKDDSPITIVGLHGQLHVAGNQILDQNDEVIALHGMSLFWSQWGGKYFNKDNITWLRDDWNCNIVRAAMGVESGGYLENPTLELAKIRAVVDACIDLGIYVIIDWHDHNAHLHQEEASNFFSQMAQMYGDKPNIIYEIYNEPEQVSWLQTVKPYSEAIIATIRQHDSDNLIIVGTPSWSQDVDIATENPVDDANVAYSLHFYAATHKEYLRDKATVALNRGYALFVSEFGICLHTGDGDIDYPSAQQWLQYMDANNLSWCKWSVNDKVEGDAALLPGALQTGGWLDSDLTESGGYIRGEILRRNQGEFESLK